MFQFDSFSFYFFLVDIDDLFKERNHKSVTFAVNLAMSDPKDLFRLMLDNEGRLPSNQITDAWVAANDYLGSPWAVKDGINHKDLKEDQMPWKSQFYDYKRPPSPPAVQGSKEAVIQDMKQRPFWYLSQDQKQWEYDMKNRKILLFMRYILSLTSSESQQEPEAASMKIPEKASPTVPVVETQKAPESTKAEKSKVANTTDAPTNSESQQEPESANLKTPEKEKDGNSNSKQTSSATEPVGEAPKTPESTKADETKVANTQPKRKRKRKPQQAVRSSPRVQKDKPNPNPSDHQISSDSD